MVEGTTRVCGVVANPVEHSMSPVLHNYIAEKMNIDMVYVPLKVLENDLSSAVKGAYALNLLGMNVTIPHKQSVIKELVSLDNAAKIVGAVNTLVRSENGYKGFNTDILGCFRALEEANIELCGETVLLIGAGGAAKAVAYLLGTKKAKKVYILNRSLNKAEELADYMNEVFENKIFFAMELKDIGQLADVNIVQEKYLAIQTTSVGMYPNINDCPVEDEAIYSLIHTAMDIVYKPFETRFLEKVKISGGKTLNGLSMLLYQGIIAFELWNDVLVTDDVAKGAYEIMEKLLIKE